MQSDTSRLSDTQNLDTNHSLSCCHSSVLPHILFSPFFLLPLLLLLLSLPPTLLLLEISLNIGLQGWRPEVDPISLVYLLPATSIDIQSVTKMLDGTPTFNTSSSSSCTPLITPSPFSHNSLSHILHLLPQTHHSFSPFPFTHLASPSHLTSSIHLTTSASNTSHLSLLSFHTYQFSSCSRLALVPFRIQLTAPSSLHLSLDLTSTSTPITASLFSFLPAFLGRSRAHELFRSSNSSVSAFLSLHPLLSMASESSLREVRAIS